MSTTLESFPRLTALEREATTTLLWASTFSFLSTIPPTLLSDGCPENFKILKKSVHYLNRLAFTCTFISPGLFLEIFPGADPFLLECWSTSRMKATMAGPSPHPSRISEGRTCSNWRISILASYVRFQKCSKCPRNSFEVIISFSICWNVPEATHQANALLKSHWNEGVLRNCAIQTCFKWDGWYLSLGKSLILAHIYG